MFKEVSSRKFDALMARRLELKKCPRCPNFGAEIVISMTAYGPKTQRAFVKCKYCGYETKPYDAFISVWDKESGRVGNFVLNQSLASAIHSAVKDWNGGKKDAVT